MTRLITLTLILSSIFLFCQGQTKKEEEDSLRQETLIALRKWFENPSFSDKHLDPAIIKTLQDSGKIEKGIKEGYWIHYSLDTSLMGKQLEVTVGEKKLPVELSAVLQKETGNYLSGEKIGVWTLYKSYDINPPFNWEINMVTKYKNGLKDGEEILYQGYDPLKPLVITNWKNGVEDGLLKLYFDKPPYNLKRVYKDINGKTSLLEEYYANGQLQGKYNDTTTNRQKLKFCRQYFESGNLKTTGFYSITNQRSGIWKTFYENGKIEIFCNFEKDSLDGDCKQFYDNGQLWTEQVFRKGNLMEVICNYNREGKKNDPGTIKNGTGSVNFYDADGNLIETDYYVDGKQTKDSR